MGNCRLPACLVLLATCALCLSLPSQARHSAGHRDITHTFTLLHAPVGVFEAEDFFSATPPGGFLPLDPPTNVARLGSDAWLRTTLAPYRPDAPADILEIPGQVFNYVDVWFELGDGSIEHYYAGDRYPYVERPVGHANVAFPLPRSADPLPVLIRVRNETSHSINFTAWTWPQAQWESHVIAKRTWYGLFLGAMLALCLYNLFVAGTLRDASYVYYVGYVLCLCACVAVLGGLADEYLWPEGKPAPVVLALVGTGTFLAVGFANSFLRIRQSSPLLYRVSTGVGALGMLMGVALVFLPRLPLIPAAHSARVIHALLLSAGAYFITVSLASYLRGVIHARFLALSMGCLLLSIVVYFSYTYGYVRYNLFIGHALEFGALAEGLLLSLALADRINQLRRGKQAAERASLAYHRSFSRHLIAAQEHERQVVAEALHDSIGHGLLVLRNNLLDCAGREPGPVDGLRDLLQAQVGCCDEILREVRGMSHDLHPHLLKRLGLSAAVESLMARALDPLGIHWHAEIDELCERMDPELQVVVYRTVQECLNNIMKHARATEVSCELVCGSEAVKGCMYDNGIGFDVAACGGTTVGLEEMAGRVGVVGGHLSIESAPGEGTTVCFSLPGVPASERAEVVA